MHTAPAASPNSTQVERSVRLACRDRFRKGKLVERVLPDIRNVLDVEAVDDRAGLEGLDTLVIDRAAQMRHDHALEEEEAHHQDYKATHGKTVGAALGAEDDQTILADLGGVAIRQAGAVTVDFLKAVVETFKGVCHGSVLTFLSFACPRRVEDFFRLEMWQE